MKFWASVSANFEYYTEEIEAESAEDAKSKAYDEVKELMQIYDPRLRPFSIRVMAVGESNERV